MRLNSEYVKKKIMFSTEEDAYFITYNILIILAVLRCTKNVRYLKDYNKLALLITINEKIQYREIIKKVLNDEVLEAIDKQVLFKIYYNSILKRRNIRGIIFALNNKDILDIKRSGKTIDVTLNNNDIVSIFKGNILFEEDIKFYEYIREHISRITSITSEKMEDIFFKDTRSDQWQIYL